MSTLLSPLISFLQHPFFWVIGLLFFSWRSRKEKWKQNSLVIALVLLVGFSNPFLYFLVCKWWEPAPIALDELSEPYDYAFVLGGFTRLYATPTDRLHLNDSANRFTHAIELFKQGKVRHLVFVSGAFTSSLPSETEADLAARTALLFGVPADCVTALSTSLNTYENAIECRKFLEAGDRGVSPRRLLITSASHLRRADACFRKQGITCDLFPTDHRTNRNPERRFSPGDFLLPSPATFTAWSALFHEWVGLASYRLLGRV
jgi:uncharacterized SAM-binding protein YcdF (DUF218 family)